MPNELRVFLGIHITPGDELREVWEEVRSLGVRATELEQMHLTLKFIGDVEAKQVAAIQEAMERVARRHSPFEVTLRGLGVFPNRRQPTVIWAGLEDAANIAALAGDLEDQLVAAGFAREERAYHPHLTLARIKRNPPRGLSELLDLYADLSFQTETVRAMTLYRSDLAPAGAVYTVLHEAPLIGDDEGD
jgi:2'-5' RNA ligase